MSTAITIVYLAAAAILVVSLIRWYTQKKLISNLSSINEQLQKVADGVADSVSMQTGVAEFSELLHHINTMLDSIRLNRSKVEYLTSKGDIPIGIFEKNIVYHRVYANKRLLDILGLSKEDALTSGQIMEQVEERLHSAETCEVDKAGHIFEYDGDRPEKKYLRIEKETDKQNVVYYVTDMSRWWEKFSHMKENSQIDELTGLYNRRGFYEEMGRHFARLTPDDHAAMVFIDADGLKEINDLDGHYTGDRYLKSIVTSLRSAVGEHSVCARLGGDEFVVYLYGFSNAEEIEQSIARIRAERGRPFAADSAQRTIQFSVGTAVYPEEATDYRKLMRIADDRMYQEKQTRKSKI